MTCDEEVYINTTYICNDSLIISLGIIIIIIIKSALLKSLHDEPQLLGSIL